MGMSEFRVYFNAATPVIVNEDLLALARLGVSRVGRGARFLNSRWHSK